MYKFKVFQFVYFRHELVQIMGLSRPTLVTRTPTYLIKVIATGKRRFVKESKLQVKEPLPMTGLEGPQAVKP
jgi:hypothetical protein